MIINIFICTTNHIYAFKFSKDALETNFLVAFVHNLLCVATTIDSMCSKICVISSLEYFLSNYTMLLSKFNSFMKTLA